ncbi:MAG: histidinol dehydrogenase, partial [Gammaproteobacteria bacterium]|nr:histidinol dehydrogenase [Gammaproteobacteria bacterium]
MSAVEIARLDSGASDFAARLAERLDWSGQADQSVETAVKGILGEVRARGDAAVIEMTNRFDRRDVSAFSELALNAADLAGAYRSIDAADREALEFAAERIRDFHSRQKQV